MCNADCSLDFSGTMTPHRVGTEEAEPEGHPSASVTLRWLWFSGGHWSPNPKKIERCLDVFLLCYVQCVDHPCTFKGT